MNFQQFLKETPLSKNSLISFKSLYHVHLSPFEENGVFPTDKISPCIQSLIHTKTKERSKLAIFNLLKRMMEHANMDHGLILCYKYEFHRGLEQNNEPDTLDYLFKTGEYRKYILHVLHLKHGLTEDELKKLDLNLIKIGNNYVYIKHKKIKICGTRIVNSFTHLYNRVRLLDDSESLTKLI